MVLCNTRDVKTNSPSASNVDVLEMEVKNSFIVKIRRCCQLLFEHDHQVSDDTLLEKFSLTLEQILKANNAESGIVIAEGIQLKIWLKAFVTRWKSLNSRVVALGLNIIGSLTMCSSGLEALQTNHDLIKDLLKNIHSTPQSSPTISCALWKLFLKLIGIPSGETFLPDDCLHSCILSIDDDSMYVSRAAKELTVQLLVKNHNEEVRKQIVLQFTSEIQKSNQPKTVKKALDILLQLTQVVEPDQLWDPELLKQVHTTLLNAIQTSDDERIINDSCTLILNCQMWSSYELENDEIWSTIFNKLYERRLILCSSKFIVSTLEFLSRREKISYNLLSMFIYPLYLCCGKPKDDVWQWNFNGISSNWLTKLEVIGENSRLTTKLLCFIISSLTDVHTCIATNETRLALTKILIYVLSDNQPTSLLQKVSQVAADTLIRLLDLWGDSWMKSLTSDDQTLLLINSVNLLSRRPLPSVMTVRLTKLVVTILNKLGNILLHVWNVVGIKLKEAIELSFSDPRWETRDSAFELMAGIAELSKDEECLRNWLKETKLVELCMLAFQDEQDYVKASAIGVLSSIPEIAMELKSELVQNMGQILLFDSEGIVRRAAAHNFQSWITNSYFRCTNLELAYKCMVHCCHDLDWEVKLSAVKFWSAVLSLVEQNEILVPQEKLKVLINSGFCAAVYILAVDEDNSVRNEVGKLLLKLDKLIPQSLFIGYVGSVVALPSKEFAQPIHYNVPKVVNSTNPSESVDESIIESVLDTIDSDVVQSKMILSTNVEETKNLIDVLAAVNVELPGDFLKQCQAVVSASCLTTDLYEINPETLLDDILIGNYESDYDEDMVIDCY